MMKGLTKRVRTYLKENPEGTLVELCVAFSDASIRDLSNVINRLERRGELTLPDPTYQYKPAMQSGREKSQTVMWRAIQHQAKKCRLIDVDRVQILSGVSADDLDRYITFLERQGYVAKRVTGLAVLDKALKRADAPIYNRRETEKAA
jgi:hypothetical protein